MTTRGQINSNFYQIVNVDVDGNPTEVKPEYITGGNVDHANVADVANSVSVSNVVGIGNIATTNYDNNANHVLYGNGVWANINSVPTANANYANFAGNSFGVNAAVGNVYITGGTNGYVLQTDGNGNLTWTAQTGGGGNASPGGANTQVQYNNSGNFAGSANFTFNNTTNTLTVTNIAGDGNQLSNLNVSNISGLGNIATINLDGNASNVLNGTGTWVPIGTATNANYANYAGNVTINAQPNITSLGNVLNLQFDNTVTPIATPNIGQMFWDTGEHTVTLGMENGVKQQIGLESYIYVKASATITNGQVVMFTGANGNNVTAAPADVTSVNFRPGYVLGVATQDIANNGFGYITSFGIVHGLNTNAYNVGDLLWLSDTTPGGLTATQPVAPNYQIQVATVVKKSGGDGHLQVIIRINDKLENLSDVTLTSPVSGQALVLDGGNVWINGNPNVANYAGYVTQAAQSNITSLGTLTSLGVSGNITSGNINGGNLVSANYFSGNGSLLTGIANGTGGEIQFNNGSNFGGANSFTFDGNLTHPNVTLSTPAGILGVSPRTVTLNLITSSGAGNIGRSNAAGGTNSLFINDANAVSISAPAVNLGANSNVKITGGSSGQVLSTDGVGNLSWASTLTITGSNTQVFYNDNGALGASANLTFNNTTNTLSVTNITGNGAGLTSITGANVTGTVANATYATSAGSAGSAGSATTAGTVTTAAQPNITSLGTLTSLSVTGNISGGNISTVGLANLANVQLKIYEETVLASANTSTSITPDLSTGSIFRYTANASFTFNSMANAVAGSSATVIVTQDGTGGRTLTSTMKFAGGAKTLSTAASAIDIISVFYDGTTYYATLSKGYA